MNDLTQLEKEKSWYRVNGTALVVMLAFGGHLPGDEHTSKGEMLDGIASMVKEYEAFGYDSKYIDTIKRYYDRGLIDEYAYELLTEMFETGKTPVNPLYLTMGVGVGIVILLYSRKKRKKK